MRAAGTLVLLLLFTLAFAEEDGTGEALPRPAQNGDITGVVHGVMDGEPFTVHTYLLEAGLPELSNTAYWEDWRGLGIGISVDVSAHVEAGIGFSAWDGALSFEFDLSDDLELLDYGEVPDIGYFESLRSPYRMSDGSLELTRVEFVDDATLRIAGNFEGIFSSPLGEGEKEISGSFAIDWVSLQPVGF